MKGMCSNINFTSTNGSLALSNKTLQKSEQNHKIGSITEIHTN